MGTRNLVCAVIDGKMKVAQYGQWDGYPTGQGEIIATFLMRRRGKGKLDQFKENLRKLKWISAEKIDELWSKFGAKDDMISFEDANKLKEAYPEFSRDTGAEILSLIEEGKVMKVQNSSDFARDSLFCEWAYLLNLDKNVLEVYRGFNKTGKVEGWFADMKPVKHKGSGEYNPITLYASIPFSKINKDTMAKLEKKACSEENDE